VSGGPAGRPQDYQAPGERACSHAEPVCRPARAPGTAVSTCTSPSFFGQGPIGALAAAAPVHVHRASKASAARMSEAGWSYATGAGRPGRASVLRAPQRSPRAPLSAAAGIRRRRSGA
jgi:hypothetical protein